MIRAFIFPYLYCLLLGSAWAVCFKKKFAESLAPVFMLHIVLVLLSGMIFHRLSIGIWCGVILSILIIAIKRENLKKNDELIIFSIAYVILFLLNYDRRFWAWDEFSHWGMFLKESLRLDALYAESNIPFWHKNYLSSITLFEVIWLRLSGRFCESDVYHAIQIFMFSMLFPIFTIRKDKDFIFQLILLSFILLLLPAIFKDGGFKFHNIIYVDYALGCVLFYCITAAFGGFDLENNYHYQILILILASSNLILTKAIGIAMFPIVFLYYFLFLIIQYGHSSQKIVIGKTLIGISIIAATSIILWYYYINFVKKYVDDTGNIQSFSHVKLTHIFSLFGNADKSDIVNLGNFRKIFIEAIFTKNVLIHGSYFVIILTLGFLCMASSSYIKDRLLMRKMQFAAVAVIICGIYYAILMYIIYATVFPMWRALELGSYNRYMGTFILAILLFVYYYSLRSIKNKRCLKKHNMIIFGLGVYLLFFHVSNFFQIVPSYFLSERFLFPFENVAERLNTATSMDDKIYIISRGRHKHNNGLIFYAMRFYCHPRVVNGGDVGPKLKKDDWSIDMPLNIFKEDLKKHKYFIYLGDIDIEFLKKYALAFENPSLLRSSTLYSISSTSKGLIRLKKKLTVESDKQSYSPLTLAAWKGDIALLEILLDNGANINELDDKPGWTPLHHAGYHGKENIISLLINRGAAVDITDNEGETALMKAARQNKLGSVNLLIKAGSDLEHLSKNSDTAISLAHKNNHINVENALKKAKEQGICNISKINN